MSWGNIAIGIVLAVFIWTRFGPGPDLSEIDVHSAIILDVRSPSEFSSGHAKGAINIPVQALQKDSLEAIAQKEQPILVYCRSGARASSATQILKDWGFTQVFNLRTQSGVESALNKR